LLVLGICRPVSAQEQTGCCYVEIDGPPTICSHNVKSADCVMTWKPGACPVNCKKNIYDAEKIDTSQEGCTFNSQGEEHCKLKNPISATEVPDIIRTVITAALGLIGALTLLMFVWGGGTWLFSAGNPEKVSAGTQTMVWAVIGVMVVLLSYVWLSGFLGYLTGG
jgi:hypothetical protein